MLGRERRVWVALVAVLVVAAAAAQDTFPLDFTRARWLGAPRAQAGEVGFRRTFALPQSPVVAQMLIAGDPGYELFVNGAPVGKGAEWSLPGRYEVTRALQAGVNVVAVKVPGGGQRPALLAVLRAMMPDGTIVEVVTDNAWRALTSPPDRWQQFGFADDAWPAAGDIGAYGIGPWGRLTRLSLGEATRAMGEIRIEVPAEQGHPASSAFAGQYSRPELSARYATYATLDRAAGRFLVGARREAMLFVRYSQPGFGLSRPALRPAEFDFDMYERDMATLAERGLHLALQGFGWPDLLGPDGKWLPLKTQPRGAGLPAFRYAYEVMDYALDRAQMHGLTVFALLDYQRPFPAETVPSAYFDKVLIAPQLWEGLLRGQAKIARYYANRPVLAGWALATDGLPPLPPRGEPLLAQAFRDYLRRRYGSLDGLRAAWGGYTPSTFDAIAVPAPNTDEPAGADFTAMGQQVRLDRLNAWVDVMRLSDPHHLFAYGEPDVVDALPTPQRLRFDLYGPFGVRPSNIDPAADGVTVPAAAFARARSLRALPQSSVVAVMSGRLGAGLLGPRAGRAVLHEWVTTAGEGAAGMITAPTFDRLAARGPAGAVVPPDETTLNRVAEHVRALQPPCVQYEPRVLVVRDEGIAGGAPAAEEARDAERVATILDQLHVPFDLVPASAVGTADEPFRVDLARYQVLLVPSLRRAPRDDFWMLVDEWLASRRPTERMLVVGRLRLRAPLGSLGVKVLGAVATALPGELPTGSSLLLQAPLAVAPTGRRLVWPAEVPVAPVMETGGGQVLGTLGKEATSAEGGVPVLMQRTLSSGGKVVLAGFSLGLGEAPILSAETLDSLAEVVRGVVGLGGVTPPLVAPPNLGVYLAEDGSVAAVVERRGTAGDLLWSTAAGRPETAWGGAVTSFDDRGWVTVSSQVAPFGVKLLPAVAEIHNVGSAGRASVRAGLVPGQGLTLQAQGPADMMLRITPGPSGSYAVAAGQGVPQVLQAGPEGYVDIEMLDSRSLTVQVFGQAPPPAVGVGPEDYLALADYHLRRRDGGAALAELERMVALYPGSSVARHAAQRREEVLRKCGVVVYVNETAEPVRVTFTGQCVVDTVLGPGAERRFYLLAGGYEEVARSLVADQMLETTTKTSVAARSVTVKEWTGHSKLPEGVAQVRLARGALSDEERKQIVEPLTGAFPAETTAVVPPAPGGTTPTPGPGGTKPETDPEKVKLEPIHIDYELTAPQPGTTSLTTKIQLENLTTRPAKLLVRHYPPPGSGQNRNEEIIVPAKNKKSVALNTGGYANIRILFEESGQELELGEHPVSGGNYQIKVLPFATAEKAEAHKRKRLAQAQAALSKKK